MEADNIKQEIKPKPLRNILGGDFMARKKILQHLPFLLFLALIGIIYIGNSYFAEKNIRKIEKLQKDLKELRYEHITMKSNLMISSRQSKVASRLDESGIKISTTPPRKIFIDN
jgi:hypothetical protein